MKPDWWGWLGDTLFPTRPLHWAYLVSPGIRGRLFKLGSMQNVRVSPQGEDTLVEFNLITGEERSILLERALFENDEYAEIFRRIDSSLL